MRAFALLVSAATTLFWATRLMKNIPYLDRLACMILPGGQSLSWHVWQSIVLPASMAAISILLLIINAAVAEPPRIIRWALVLPVVSTLFYYATVTGIAYDGPPC